MQSQDSGLIRRFLRGDREAITEVDGWIEHAIWPYRQRLSDDWEDLLQDVRLELTRLLRENAFRGESSLKTYVWRVANHICVDRLRSATKWKWTHLETIEEDLGHEGLISRSEGPRHEARDLIKRVLRELSVECRQLWSLILAGFSYSEMSRKLDIAEGTLRVRVLRCRKKAIAIRDQLLHRDSTPD
ncbi:MAG: sigma-70 family RNA polymerase sigma factor [bacterium]|nr:sigma-70 family RNA polymerase sigma factor [bacterium]